MSRRHLVIGGFLLILLAGCLLWRRSIPRAIRTPDAGKAPSADSTPPALFPKPPVDARRSPGTEPGTTGQSREKLLRFLAQRLSYRTLSLVDDGTAESLHTLAFGDNPSFRTFVREAQELLGEEFSGAIRSLLGEVSSSSHRSVLLLMMGMAGCSDAIDVLKSSLAEGRDLPSMAAAAYGLGLMKHEAAFEFLAGYYGTLRELETGGDLEGVKRAVEAGLGANGERALAVLLEGARSQLSRIISEDGPLQNAEAAFPYYSDRWLSHLRIDQPTLQIRSLIESSEDPRLRFSLVTALAENKTEANYDYLITLHRDSQDPLLRTAITKALVATALRLDENASRTQEPVRRSLEKLLQQSAAREFVTFDTAETLMALACRLEGPVSQGWLDAFFKQDLKALYGERAAQFQSSLAHLAGEGKAGQHLFSKLLEGVTATRERAHLLADYYRNRSVTFSEGRDVRLLADVFRKADGEGHDFRHLIGALRRASAEQDYVLDAFKQSFDRQAPGQQIEIVAAAGDLGPVSAPFLEGVLNRAEGVILRLTAARELLQSNPPPELRERLASQLAPLLAPSGKVGGDIFYASGQNRYVYGEVVLEYYTRFGTPRDFPLLESIPDLVIFDEGVPEPWVIMYRDTLRAQCRHARDTIYLRAGTP